MGGYESPSRLENLVTVESQNEPRAGSQAEGRRRTRTTVAAQQAPYTERAGVRRLPVTRTQWRSGLRVASVEDAAGVPGTVLSTCRDS